MSYDRFAVGEVAICIGGLTGKEHECTVLALPVQFDTFFQTEGKVWKRPAGMYLVECSDGTWACLQWQLKKKRPPSEDRKTVSWNECPWQPQREIA